MDIILDTNIIRNDFLLKSRNIEIVLDYLQKTGSGIIMPQIILDEISGLYRRELIDKTEQLNKSITNLSSILTGKDKITDIDFDIDVETKKYLMHLKERLDIDYHSIIPYNSQYLQEISRRAILRMKPASEDGNGFRDVLIWLTILDYAKICLEKQIIFISNNTRDFAGPDRNKLNDSLIRECLDSNVKINYYVSIKDFITDHSSKIDYITLEWLRDRIDEQTILFKIMEVLSNLPYYWKYRLGDKIGDSVLDNFEYKHINKLEYKRFYIYEMQDGTHIINLEVVAEAEMEIETPYRDHRNRYQLEPINYSQDTFEITYRSIPIKFIFEISEKKEALSDLEISDWELA